MKMLYRNDSTHEETLVEVRLDENIKVRTTENRVGVLTTDRAESSYGQAVLVIDGTAYGPGNTIGRQPLLVTEFKPIRTAALPFGDALLDALAAPPEPPAITAWNKRVIAANTQGKHWDEGVLDFVADFPTDQEKTGAQEKAAV